jgi:hypothetical protein
LRSTPYTGGGLDDQLEEQMRAFLRGGGAQYEATTNTVHLSRVFLWYGGDFVRAHRMPTFLPARRARLLSVLRPWMAGELTDDASIEFQSYDWGLRCAVG